MGSGLYPLPREGRESHVVYVRADLSRMNSSSHLRDSSGPEYTIGQVMNRAALSFLHEAIFVAQASCSKAYAFAVEENVRVDDEHSTDGGPSRRRVLADPTGPREGSPS